MQKNQLTVVEEGRRPGILLDTNEGGVSLAAWAEEIMDGIRPLAEMLDSAHGGELFGQTWEEQLGKIKDPAATPSARILEVVHRQEIPFFRFAMNQSIAHKGYFDEHPLRDQDMQMYKTMASESLHRQQEIEDTDAVDFARFLQAYLAFQ
jgi:glutamate--cysteine ligase